MLCLTWYSKIGSSKNRQFDFGSSEEPQPLNHALLDMVFIFFIYLFIFQNKSCKNFEMKFENFEMKFEKKKLTLTREQTDKNFWLEIYI